MAQLAWVSASASAQAAVGQHSLQSLSVSQANALASVWLAAYASLHAAALLEHQVALPHSNGSIMP